MDMRRASTRHPNDHPQPLSSIAALPDPLTVHHPVPPQQSSLFYNISQAAYPILSTTDTLQDPTTPVVNTWNPTPELISHLIQHFNLLPHLGSLPDNGSSSPSPSLPSASAAQSEQLSFLHTSSTRHTSDSQAVAEDPRLADPSSSASATACTMEPQDNKWPTFIKLVQQVPPQSRTFYKNAPFLFHRQGSTGAASSSSPTTDSVGCFSPRLKTLVDPFDSERDVLSKIYILTTADFEGDIITTALDDSPAQHQQLPSLKYLLKVFPDRTPFKHVATTSAAARVDIKSKPSREREFMKQVVQDAIEHEIGALAWVDQYLSLTQTLKLVGYAYKRCGGKSASDTSGLEAYGILGFILMEFPDDGYLYQAPTEEYPARESQQIEMSERLAEI
ncbi:hypothetical protein EC991_008514 [Linnemannia zychae]|nr:hypothetical protein EC991_008514 [Linnemannia zychae]